MRQFILSAVLLCVAFTFKAQTPFTVQVQEITLEDAPAVQSFVHAQQGNKWLILGGRTDGLHQRQPFASFLVEGNNTMVYVIDIAAGTVASANLDGLEPSIYESLQSTNQEFEQRDNTLYTMGGYGYSAEALDHITFPYLTAVDIAGLIAAVESGQTGAELAPHFRQIEDAFFAITGGYLGLLDNVFYQAGGQYFEGRYNPMGPDHGPGFIQQYTETISRFTIEDDGETLGFTVLDTWNDPNNLHRRDYNMAPQVFPDGTEGFTMFSGVFQIDQDIPWHNTVDITADTYTVNNNFDQLLNQYHTAHMTIHDAENSAMHTIFFGGMSRYYFNEDGDLFDDINVPFVTTISKVSRYADGSMMETAIGDMPGLLGSGAEFIPAAGMTETAHGVLELDALPNEPVTVGYLIGGIESSAENIFFVNDGSQSAATTRVFEVILERGAVGTEEAVISSSVYFDPQVYPNPTDGDVHLEFHLRSGGQVQGTLIDSSGAMVQQLFSTSKPSGWIAYDIDLSSFKPGVYHIQISNHNHRETVPVVVKAR
jgi:hypothetical protein